MPHATASVDGTVIADSDAFHFVEGNVYFPPSSIKDFAQTLTPTDHTTACPWKGEGHYYDIHVNGKTLSNAAWYYPQPLEKATHIKDHVAFYKTKVHIEKDDEGASDANGVHAEKQHHSLLDKVKHVF